MIALVPEGNLSTVVAVAADLAPTAQSVTDLVDVT